MVCASTYRGEYISNAIENKKRLRIGGICGKYLEVFLINESKFKFSIFNYIIDILSWYCKWYWGRKEKNVLYYKGNWNFQKRILKVIKNIILSPT